MATLYIDTLEDKDNTRIVLTYGDETLPQACCGGLYSQSRLDIGQTFKSAKLRGNFNFI